MLASVPAGHWISYGDLARAAGGSDSHARTLNQRLIRHAVDGAHRVLTADGAISPNALGDPAGVRARLEAEGARFTAGRAHPETRIRPTCR